MAKHLNVYVVEEFEAGGEQRKNPHPGGGSCFPTARVRVSTCSSSPELRSAVSW